MAKFKVVLKRVGYAEVEVEAESAADAKRQMADEELAWECFHTASNAWHAPEIKIDSVKRAQ